MSDRGTPDKEKPKPYVFLGTYATNGTVFLTTDSQEEIGVNVENTQLAYWILAKRIYQERVTAVDKPLFSDMILVVSNLGNCLLHLFGRNFSNPKGERTPSLLAYVDEKKHFCGWSLEKEDPNLFTDLIRLNQFNDEVAKHTDESKVELLLTLDRELVQRLLQTTKDVWLWYGRHKYPQGIPADQTTEFTEDYCLLE
ncbi:MAG: hypothetical protein ABSG21_12495 [Spirochaetia bacterium]|jgi:hypothetical protein